MCMSRDDVSPEVKQDALRCLQVGDSVPSWYDKSGETNRILFSRGFHLLRKHRHEIATLRILYDPSSEALSAL